MTASETNFFLADDPVDREGYLDPPETKRFLFKVVEHRLDIIESHNDTSGKCIAILGPRKVGKTILLRQLCSAHPNISKYLDISRLKPPVDFFKLFKDVQAGGKKRLFLDEVSKVSADDLADFVAAVKLFSTQITFVYTGSTKAAVRKIHDKIGRGVEYELPPILWIEHLAWKANADVFDSDKYKASISLTSFNNYIQYGGFSEENEGFDYFKSVVQDTVESILDYDELCHMDMVQLNLILVYIALCQLVYCDKHSRKYCTIPSLSKRVQDALDSTYIKIKRHIDMPTSAIATVCNMLIDSGLAKRMYTQFFENVDLDDGYQVKTIDKNVPSLIFEYPWYASSVILDVLSDPLDTMWGKRVEDMLFLKMTYVYDFVDKYRFANYEEIDAIYQVGVDYYGLECKFRSRKHITNTQLDGYRTLAKRLNLTRMDITSKDPSIQIDEYTSIFGVDSVVASLELELINKRLEGRRNSADIPNLITRYQV